MTREEEISQMAKSYTQVVYDSLDDFSDITDAYVDGAKWADETMIDKACEWISQSYTSGVLDWKNCDSIIENFKKAMEE